MANNLKIYSNDGRETSYGIYVDGVFKVNVPITPTQIENMTPNTELIASHGDDRYVVPTSDLVIQTGYYKASQEKIKTS